MIKGMFIENFKSFRKARLALAQVTFVVGLNGSGKTNALEALRFASWLARGGNLGQIDPLLGEGRDQIRGKLDEICRKDSESFSISFDFQNGRHYRLESCYGIRKSSAGKKCCMVDSERLLDPSDHSALYRSESVVVRDDERLLQVSLDRFGVGVDAGIEVSSLQSLYGQLASASRFVNARAKDEIPAVAKYLQNGLSKIYCLAPNFRRVVGYASAANGAVLECDGANLSAVVLKIFGDEKRKRQFLELVKRLPEREFEGIGFVATRPLEKDLILPDTEVQLFMKEPGNGIIPIRLLSEGTIRVLLVAAALMSVPEGSLVILEEIDTGIHPGRVAHLVQWLYQVAEERSVQVLATTHNASLMNAIPRRELENVVLCYRSAEGDSKLMRLGDLEDFVPLMMRDNLGNLVASELIERELSALSVGRTGGMHG